MVVWLWGQGTNAPSVVVFFHPNKPTFRMRFSQKKKKIYCMILIGLNTVVEACVHRAGGVDNVGKDSFHFVRSVLDVLSTTSIAASRNFLSAGSGENFQRDGTCLWVGHKKRVALVQSNRKLPRFRIVSLQIFTTEFRNFTNDISPGAGHPLNIQVAYSMSNIAAGFSTLETSTEYL